MTLHHLSTTLPTDSGMYGIVLSVECFSLLVFLYRYFFSLAEDHLSFQSFFFRMCSRWGLTLISIPLAPNGHEIWSDTYTSEESAPSSTSSKTRKGWSWWNFPLSSRRTPARTAAEKETTADPLHVPYNVSMSDDVFSLQPSGDSRSTTKSVVRQK